MSNEHNKIRNYTGLVLAGGRGSRMGGQDKGLVQHNSRPLVSYSLDALQPHCRQIYINCNRNLDSYAAFGFPLLPDPDDSFPGPLRALAALLPELPASDLLILPCDTPGVGAEQIATLIEVGEAYPDHWIYLRAEGRDHPLHALLPESLKSPLQEYIRHTDERRLMRAIDALPHVAVELPESLQLNLNRL